MPHSGENIYVAITGLAGGTIAMIDATLIEISLSGIINVTVYSALGAAIGIIVKSFFDWLKSKF